MARVAGARAGRRSIPGLSAALAAREAYFDRSFCMTPLGAPCGWCERRERLLAGEPLTVSGETIWSALFDERTPRAWDEFMYDGSPYVVTGDRLEVGGLTSLSAG